MVIRDVGPFFGSMLIVVLRAGAAGERAGDVARRDLVGHLGVAGDYVCGVEVFAPTVSVESVAGNRYAYL
jgi:hypothetical protein